MHNGWQEKELASGCRFNDIEQRFFTIYNEGKRKYGGSSWTNNGVGLGVAT